jgi:biopolymer transport protein ExbD
VKLRKSRQARRGRIEIIPMIDVMFFLLATFMLASLTMQNLNSLRVDLPRGTAERMQSTHPITMTVTREGRIYLDQSEVTQDTLVARLRPMLSSPDQAITVAADTLAPNGVVVHCMLLAREAGAERFLIAVRHE